MTLHAATFVGLFLVRLASGTSAAASLMPTSSSYCVLEPINLSLQITNHGRERIYVELDYPLFQYFGDYGIQLTVAGDAKFNLQRRQFPERTSIVFSFISLNPGESRTITVFFQRYMGDLPPGTHHVLYSVRIPYWSWPDRRPLDHRSLNIYTMMISSILYFQRNTTGAALISSKYW